MMTQREVAAFDAAVLDIVQTANADDITPSFPEIVRVLAQREFPIGNPPFRSVDRSLQRLRRAGKVGHLSAADGGPGWAVTGE